jgi:hypothetical protein
MGGNAAEGQGGAFWRKERATMPITLAERCVKAGTSLHGCCPACGASLVRVVERTPMVVRTSAKGEAKHAHGLRTSTSGTMTAPPTTTTTGWRPSCRCPDAPPVPATVLDPFGGAGTTALAAANLGRSSIVCELNRDYCEMARRRISDNVGLVCHVTVEEGANGE